MTCCGRSSRNCRGSWTGELRRRRPGMIRVPVALRERAVGARPRPESGVRGVWWLRAVRYLTARPVASCAPPSWSRRSSASPSSNSWLPTEVKRMSIRSAASMAGSSWSRPEMGGLAHGGGVGEGGGLRLLEGLVGEALGFGEGGLDVFLAADGGHDGGVGLAGDLGVAPEEGIGAAGLEGVDADLEDGVLGELVLVGLALVVGGHAGLPLGEAVHDDLALHVAGEAEELKGGVGVGDALGDAELVDPGGGGGALGVRALGDVDDPAVGAGGEEVWCGA